MPRSSIWIAGAIALGVIAWMASGYFGEPESGPQNPTASRARQPTLVAVRSSQAQTVERTLLLHGDVRPARTTAVPAETAGRLKRILVREGEQVAAGQKIFELSLEARESQRLEARALSRRLKSELEGARSLAQEGYAARQRILQLEADLASAEAQLARIEEEIADTTVTAPYQGIINDIAVEFNEFVAIGAVLATIIDNSVLRVVVDVAQQDIANVETGRVARVRFGDGRLARGRICFVSARAVAATRTFSAEVWVANDKAADNVRFAIPSGISAEVSFPLGATSAHLVSPAILALDDGGRLGVKTVGAGHTVAFHPVRIVRSAEQGVWIGGLPPTSQLITLGQGFVRAGEQVRTVQADEQQGSPEGGEPQPTATTAQSVSAAGVSQPPSSTNRTPGVTATPPTCDRMQHSINANETPKSARPSRATAPASKQPGTVRSGEQARGPP
jgi:membrane fusion protein, multidrug efflux system